MKKILFALMVSCVGLFAEGLNLNDDNLVEQFGAAIVKEKLSLYDPDELGLWMLKKNYNSKYQKVKNDEFEFNDAKAWALDNFKKKLDMVQPIDKQAHFQLDANVEFGEYDFKMQRFPVKALVEGAYMEYAGKGELVSSYSASKLVFDNATDKYNYLEMDKDQAKTFIQSKKDKYGNIDRKLLARYVYTITNFQENNEFKPNESQMTIKFTGHLVSVAFMDKEGKNILKTVNFDQNSTQNDSNNTQITNTTEEQK